MSDVFDLEDDVREDEDNSTQCYCHSLTMNAIIKIISWHPVFHSQCNPPFFVKHKNIKDEQLTSTFSIQSKPRHSHTGVVVRPEVSSLRVVGSTPTQWTGLSIY
jgi:hypothetical protein